MDEDFVTVDRVESSVVSTSDEHCATVVVVEQTVLTDEMLSYVSTEQRDTQVVAEGQQGPRGATGQIGPAGGTVFTKTAGMNLSGHHVVKLTANDEAVYADNELLSDTHIVVGITLGAASIGTDVDIQSFGELQEPSWSWTPGGAIYLGANGALTQAVPVSPAVFSLCVGFATTTDIMFILVGTPIVLA